MQAAYPEMMESVQRVARVVKDEEHRYATTFLVAEKEFPTMRCARSPATPFPARSPSSSTTPTAWRSTSRRTWRASAAWQSTAKASTREMEQQRERARASWKGAEKGAVAPAYQKLLEQGRTKFLGYTDLEATSRVIGLLVDQRTGGRDSRRRAGRAGVRPDAVLRRIRRPGGRPRRAVFGRGRKGGRCGNRFPRRARPDRASHPRALRHSHRRRAARRSGRAAARRHAAQPHRHAPAARRAAAGAGHARQAGGQRGGARPAALRFHALRRPGSPPKSKKSSGS